MTEWEVAVELNNSDVKRLQSEILEATSSCSVIPPRRGWIWSLFTGPDKICVLLEKLILRCFFAFLFITVAIFIYLTIPNQIIGLFTIIVAFAICVMIYIYCIEPVGLRILAFERFMVTPSNSNSTLSRSITEWEPLAAGHYILTCDLNKKIHYRVGLSEKKEEVLIDVNVLIDSGVCLFLLQKIDKQSKSIPFVIPSQVLLELQTEVRSVLIDT